MDPAEFVRFRLWLGKTQLELSHLLGTSVRAVCAYEGSWRSIPPHVERQLLFLSWQRLRGRVTRSACWKQLRCPPAIRRQCPAHEFHLGDICWFINGTHCHGAVQTSWVEKMRLCRPCKMLRPLWREVGSPVGLEPSPCPGGRSAALRARGGS